MKGMPKKRKLPPGWVEGTLQEFLGASDADMEAINLSVQLSIEVKRRFDKSGLTPEQLAERCEFKLAAIKRIINPGARSKLDEMFQVYFALGGRFKDLHSKKRSPVKS